MFTFQQVKGLTNSQARSRIVRDQEGFVWIGTLNGLARFDGYGVREYRNVAENPRTLSGTVIKSLLVDSRNRLWVGTFPAGVNLYDRRADRFYTLHPRAGDSAWHKSAAILAICEDRDGGIWVGTAGAGVTHLQLPDGLSSVISDTLLAQVRFATYTLGTPRNDAVDLAVRNDGTIAVASDSGLLIITPASHSVSRLNHESPSGRTLDRASVACLRQHAGGALWAGTESEGLFRIDPEARSVRNYRHVEGDPLSLRSNDIQDIAIDDDGSLWLGTAEGIQRFSPVQGRELSFLATGLNPLYRSYLTYLSVDAGGTLWAGKFDGGVYWLSRKSRLLPHVGVPDSRGTAPRRFDTIERDRKGNVWFTSADRVYHIDLATNEVIGAIDVFRGKEPTYGNCTSFLDRNGTLWYGTWGLGLYRIDLERNTVRNYGAASGLGEARTVQGIAQATGDSLWIAAYSDGLKKFDPVTGRFSDVPGFSKQNVWSVLPDRRGKMWLGSETEGVTVLDPATGAVQVLHHSSQDSNSLGRNDARWILEDQGGRMWIGAGTLVHMWDPATRAITRYPNRSAQKALFAQPRGIDAQGRVWVDFLYESISRLDPATGSYTHFDHSDGASHVVSDMLTLPDGKVVLVGSEGANILHPDSLVRKRPAPPLILSKISVNDEAFSLPGSQNEPHTLNLSHTQNVLEFEFVAADIDAAGRVQYHYRLEGVEDGWVNPQDRRFVRYTNLAPGGYRFRVRAASVWNEWPQQEIALTVNIAPPWWRTPWAYSASILAALGLLFAAYRIRLNQLRLTQRADMEHFQAERLAEVDRLKSRFFSSISHEFRTPLTLILGPVDHLLEAADSSSRAKLQLVRENARKLLGLVNELLDLSRMEAGMMRLQVARGDALQFLRRGVLSFQSWAERKKITLTFEADGTAGAACFDADKLEKIVNNVVSNALKFTPEGGTVAVRVSRSGPRAEFLRIAVSDSGPGMAPEHLPHVFDRFYRVDETHRTEGSGIGLALAKELVELHHGTIQVSSTQGAGSVFTIDLPLEAEAYKPGEIVDAGGQTEVSGGDEGGSPASESRAPAAGQTGIEKPIVLIVEDNDDLRAYLRENLETDYTVEEAANGKEGHRRAIDLIPDLVISDVMMPVMDGMELCRTLKQDVRTSHVPVILLTARAESDSKIEGLELGADDYVTKPFEMKELLARARNLIGQRLELRKKYAAGVVLKPGEVAVTSLDDALLKRVTETIEKHMGEEDFGVDDLARETCLSRTHLNRKLQALTNLSPGQCIRYMRLQRARELLEKGAGSVSDVAFQVGFGNLSHFSASFRERFGILPADVLRGRARP